MGNGYECTGEDWYQELDTCNYDTLFQILMSAALEITIAMHLLSAPASPPVSHVLVAMVTLGMAQHVQV
jgi:hypothetical protein